MRRSVAALLVGIALAGCGREEEADLPAACRVGHEAVRSALAAAPGEVRLEDTTRLSECFQRTSEQADVLLVGETYLTVAARLADEAAARPGSAAALRLGYLMGAVQRGTGDTQGIYDELVRRLEQEAARLDDSAAFRRGERAGLQSG